MSDKKSVRITIGVVGFLMFLIAFSMFSLPILSNSICENYSRPVVAKIKVNKEQKTLEIKYGTKDDDLLKTLQQNRFHFPFYLKLWQLFFFGSLILMFGLLIIGEVYDLKKSDNDQMIFGLIIVSAFLIVWVSGGIWSLKVYNQGGQIVAIKEAFKDAALAKMIIGYYKDSVFFGWLIINGLLLVIYSIVMFFISAFFELVLSEIKKAVKKYWQNYEKRLFKEVFLKNEDSLLANLSAGSEVLQILPNNAVEIIRYRYKVEFRPWPVFIPQKEVVANVSLDNFFRHLVSATKEEAYAELLEKVQTGYGAKFSEAAKEVMNNFLAELSLRAKTNFTEKASSVRRKEIEEAKEHAERTFQRSSAGVLRKFKEDVANIGQAEILDMLSGLKKNISVEIARSVSDLPTRGTDFANRQLSILPPNVKLHFEINEYQIMVIEQPPMVRKVFFSARYSENGKKVLSPSLAFPFVVFIVTLKNGEFYNLRTYYNNKPLQSLEDSLYYPNLPNLNYNCAVCLKFPGHQKTSPIDRVNEILNHFWNSQFNTDLRGNYESYRSMDERLESISAWEKASQKDPRFPLLIDWRRINGLRQEIGRAIMDDGLNQTNQPLLARIEKHIETTFADSGRVFHEALKKKFSAMPVQNRHTYIFSDSLRKDEEEIIDSYNGVLQGSFESALQADMSGDLFRLFDDSAENSLKEIFTALGKEVLFRRRVDGPTLVEKIKQENRR